MGPYGEGLSRLGRLVAAARDDALAARRRVPDEARARLLARAAADAGGARRWPRAAWAAAAVALALLGAGLLAVVVPRRPPPLGALVGGMRPSPGTTPWLEAGSAAELPVTFSDGTGFWLKAGGRARLAEVTSAGARLELERGAVRASVVPRDGAAWSVAAGPFAVEVRGTSFELAWDPTSGRFGLGVQEGIVWVRGPLLSAGRAVVAGELLQVSLVERRLELTDGDPARIEASLLAGAAAGGPAPTLAEVAAAAAGAGPEARGEAVPRSVAVAASPGSAVAERAGGTAERGGRRGDAGAVTGSGDWRARSMEGDHPGALEAAERLGFTDLCARLGPEDLYELADTARLAGGAMRAREAFLALRARFERTPYAAAAGFMLGRVALDLESRPDEAARWFRAYLAEALEAAGEVAAAREAARAYLAAHPLGPHADVAESVLAR